MGEYLDQKGAWAVSEPVDVHPRSVRQFKPVRAPKRQAEFAREKFQSHPLGVALDRAAGRVPATVSAIDAAMSHGAYTFLCVGTPSTCSLVTLTPYLPARRRTPISSGSSGARTGSSLEPSAPPAERSRQGRERL